MSMRSIVLDEHDILAVQAFQPALEALALAFAAGHRNRRVEFDLGFMARSSG